MALIDHIDGPNRRIYLGIESTQSDLQPMDIYKEMRTLRRLNESLRKFDVFLSGLGNVPKGGGKGTERYTRENSGTRIVPYDASHELTVIGTIITDDDQEGTACFDRSLLTPGVQVDINYIPKQVEVIEVNTGSAVTEQDKVDIAVEVMEKLLSDHATVDGSLAQAIAIMTGRTALIPASV